MSAVLHVNDQNFESEIVRSEIPAMVDFYATWCGPCKSLTPIVEDLAREFQGRLKVAKLDIDEAPGVASSHGIMAVPTLIFFKNRNEHRKVTGFKNKPELLQIVNDLLKT